MGQIQNLIDSLTAARDAIRTKLVTLGLATATADLAECADAVSGIAANGNVSKTLDTGTTSYTIPAGYHGGTGKVQIVTEEKTVSPSTSAQSVTPSSGKVLSKVTVNAASYETWTLTLESGGTKTIKVFEVT